ncbi:thioredoxin domain-containing protein [Sphingomonas abietis]|uniref:Thioredoxin domain-containing protein n=1 Tax=Sphingomonas abietis TaxID=3012344 RepID=A0ABY7NPE9_9SPHN|nr:thioredoxin domain-containing protein [Sphingomonas abietis]WBO23087.1 thioredoxin domain-containing protein [Sphingomonas abietis]
MIRPVLALLALAAPLVAPAASAATTRHLPTHRVQHGPVDWSHTVTLTPDGGIRMGNPAAKVKVVEFSSFTCPHCAVLAGEAFTPLTDKYVRGGQVSFELRAALRDAIDLTVALAARCVAPPRYFPAVEQIMATQQEWFPKAADYVDAHRDELNGTGKTQAIHAMLTSIGIEATLAPQGVTPAALDACLISKPAEDALQKTTNDAWNVRKINGTPGIMINDVLKPDIHSWALLETAIQAGLKG